MKSETKTLLIGLVLVISVLSVWIAVAAGSDDLLEEYETSDREFKSVGIGDMTVYWHQRMIDDAIVEGDYIVYQFDKKTKELIDKRTHWRSGLPEHVTPVITKEEAESMVKGEVQFTKLYIISPDSVVFPIEPTPENPCWVVRSVDNGSMVVTVIDAMDGKILGYGLPPPYTGFSFSGPTSYPWGTDPDTCSGAWTAHYMNAANWFNTMGYHTEAVEWPTEAKVKSHIQSTETAMFYEIAHGDSTVFANGCTAGTNNYDYTYASEIETWIAGYTKMPFTFIGSCGGMCNVGPNTLSYEFRKGSTTKTATVGYCGMGKPDCNDCWGYSLDWQHDLFNHMNQGWTVKAAFDKACADYPWCVGCMRFAGDANFKVVPVVDRVSMPDIWVYPTSFDVTLPTNTIQDYKLRIGNAGEALLTYDISDVETTALVMYGTSTVGTIDNTQNTECVEGESSSDIQNSEVVLVQSGTHQIDLNKAEKTNPPVTSVALGSELLVNPGFETGDLPPWYTEVWTIVTDNPHSGTYCAYVEGNNWIKQDFGGVPVSDITSVTFWSKQPEEAIQAIDFFYDDGTYTEDIVYPTSTWQQFDITSWLTSGSTLTGIRIWGYSGGGPDETYIDDVSIQISGEPDCPWLDEYPKSGSVELGNYDEIIVSIDTTGLDPGDYSANIIIANNDPDEDPTIVPVDLTVTGPKPDLVITDIWHEGNKVYYKIKNIGTEKAGSSRTSLTVDGVYKKYDSVRSLEAGEERTESFRYKWACTEQSDEIKVCADYKNVVAESNEGNNCKTETWDCDGGNGDKPDLVVTDVWNKGNKIYYKIKNIGREKAGSSRTSLTVDGDYKKYDSVRSLGAGKERTESFRYKWTCTNPSDEIKVCADYKNAVAESNEGNNCKTETWECEG